MKEKAELIGINDAQYGKSLSGILMMETTACARLKLVLRITGLRHFQTEAA